MAAIECDSLEKDYPLPVTLRDLARGRLRGQPKTALRGVTLTVAEGEVLAILGLNGAGKSTLLKCLAGLIRPSRGRAMVAGHDCREAGAALRQDCVYVAPDARSFAWRLSGRDNLDFFAALHGYRGGDRKARVNHALAEVGLDDEAANRRVETYSTGMRQRLALARGFLGHARVVLLDEPTAGLDAPSTRELWDRIQSFSTAGRTVVVATHQAAEAKAVAKRAVILAAGRITFEGTPSAAAEAVGAV